jgi:hypothetical protein
VARCLARAGLRPVVLGWHRRSPIGLLPGCRRYPLLELNARFWASLPCALEAGLDDPDLLVRADEAAAGPGRR